MGCWNGTCGLSGLPINVGTEMYVFPIVESYRDSFCYSTALYRPSVLPFRAEYNDYGGGEDCGGVGLDILMDGIKSRLVEMEVGENQYHDIAVKREEFDVDKFFEACHESRLLFKNILSGYEGQPKTKNVFFTMVRKDVVDRLWNEWSFDFWKPRDMKEIPEGFESDQYYIKNVTYAKLAEMIPDYLEHQASESISEHIQVAIDAYVANGENDKAEDMKDFWQREAFFREGKREHMLSSSFGHAFGTGYAGGGFANFADIKEKILDAYLGNNKEVAYEIMRECLVGIMVNSYMEHIRKVWTPPMHQGSQSECFDEYKLMNRIANDLIAEREREYYHDEDE